MNAVSLIGGVRRFVLVVLGVVAVTAVISLALGGVVGASALRSISLGFYLVGSFLLVGGFLIGNPRPWRTTRSDRGFLRGGAEIRSTTVEERQDAIGASATYIAIGIVVLMLGVVCDQRVALF